MKLSDDFWNGFMAALIASIILAAALRLVWP